MKYILIFAAYTIMMLILSLPLSENLNIRVLGGSSVDSNGAYWFQWFTKRCVFKLDLSSFYHNDFFAYPSGRNLIFNYGPPLIAILSIPFQIAFDFPACYNLFIFMLMALNGLACFILLDYIYKETLSAFTGGLFFCINPYISYHVEGGRPEQIAIFWIPLFILFLIKTRDEKNKKYAIIAAALLLITSLSYWYYAVFLIIFTALFIVYFIIAEDKGRLEFIKNAVLIFALYGVFMFILFSYPVIVKGINPSGYALIRPFPSFDDIALKKTPFYFVYMTNFTANLVTLHLFIIISLIIIAFSLLNMRSLRNNLFYVITAVFFLILSLGPYLKISGHIIALPYILLYYFIPFFPRLWWPINAFPLTLVCVTILLTAIVHRTRSKLNPAAKIIFPAILATMYFFPYYNSQYIIVNSVPWLKKLRVFNFCDLNKPHDVYYYLKEQRDCAIIELPFGGGGLDFLRNQTIHGKKIFESPGYDKKEIFWPKEQLQYFHSNAFLSYIDQLLSIKAMDNPGYENLANEASIKVGLRQLYALGFRFIVINPHYFIYGRDRHSLLNEFKRILKRPCKEYADGVVLYRIEELIND